MAALHLDSGSLIAILTVRRRTIVRSSFISLVFSSAVWRAAVSRTH